MTSNARRIGLIAAGGTGGHLFPAEALAVELVNRGWTIDLATDKRVEQFGKQFPARQIHVFPAATPSVRNPLKLARAMIALTSGYWQARTALKRKNYRAVIGFGGYPTVSPVLAATHLGIPTLIHEQNGVMGRANRLLSLRVNKIGLSLPVKNLEKSVQENTVITGNPVRPAVLAVAGKPFLAPGSKDPINLLIFGGSQGAQIFSKIMPDALALLEKSVLNRLHIIQQGRKEDCKNLTATYMKMGLQAEVSAFFDDLPKKIAESHLVICRAGASSVTELSVIGRPSILIPLPGALDQDQSINAQIMSDAGGGFILQQNNLTPEAMAKILSSSLANSEKLTQYANAAASIGKPNAVTELADLFEKTAE